MWTLGSRGPGQNIWVAAATTRRVARGGERSGKPGKSWKSRTGKILRNRWLKAWQGQKANRREAGWRRKTLLNPLKKIVFNLHLQIQKYNLLKYTNTFWNFEKNLKKNKKIEKIWKFLKKCLPTMARGTVDLIKNY